MNNIDRFLNEQTELELKDLNVQRDFLYLE